MKKVGLYFGSFNPIHMGHVVIAQYMREFSDLDEVWLIVTPHNPFKKKANLLDDRARYNLVQRSVESIPGLRASDVEFSLPQPSYTTDTLAHLKEQHPELRFCLIMGSDNLSNLHKWKNAEYLVTNYSVYVYPRSDGGSGPYTDHESVMVVDAPQMDLSSSFIRQAISEGKDVSAMVPSSAWQEIREMHYYE
ncbi:MAG: nicotinate-nucleotide adenylyltransferase [Flavobacteriales bacterium]|nr:nicotinate-nucleotide adenylyltransferase [Flavobacteriales bacterium]